MRISAAIPAILMTVGLSALPVFPAQAQTFADPADEVREEVRDIWADFLMDSHIQRQVDKALDLINAGNVQQGIEQLTELAESGNSEAQYELGLAYHPDNSAAPELEKSAYWLGQAADNGHVEASFLSGVMALLGRGRAADNDVAFGYFLFAAENDHPDAQAFAGVMFAEGKGVTRDMSKGRQWLNTAITGGSTLATQFLADLDAALATPTPTPSLFDDPATFPAPDPDMVARAEAGDPEMQYELGAWHAHPNNPDGDLTLAWLWYRRAAEAGLGHAQYELGFAYMNGWGVDADLERAHHWLTAAYANEYDLAAQGLYELEQRTQPTTNSGLSFESGQDAFDSGDIDGARAIWEFLAERGNPAAQAKMGELYLYGRSVETDYPQALDWFNRAAAQLDPGGQYYLGRMYETGRGVAKDLEQARHWYSLAANQGEHTAQLNLGVMHQYGEGGPIDLREALRLYELASTQNNPLAMFNAGLMHYYAQGTLKNAEMARQYWTDAARLGYAEAAALLDELF